VIACDGTKFNEGIYKIKTTEGTEKAVYGFWSGFLGYHRSEFEGDNGYTITHLLTGRRVFWVKRAREARKFISEAELLDWNFENPDSPKAQANIFPCMGIISRLGSKHTSL
jgi:hypothetical protein